MAPQALWCLYGQSLGHFGEDLASLSACWPSSASELLAKRTPKPKGGPGRSCGTCMPSHRVFARAMYVKFQLGSLSGLRRDLRLTWLPASTPGMTCVGPLSDNILVGVKVLM